MIALWLAGVAAVWLALSWTKLAEAPEMYCIAENMTTVNVHNYAREIDNDQEYNLVAMAT